MALATEQTDTLTVHPDRAAMAEALAGPIATALETAIARDGEAVLAVSGGSTPEALYKRLAETELDWARVCVVLVDERWVDAGEPGSNETFLRSTLMTGKAAAARLIGLKARGETPLDGVADVTASLSGVRFPPDVVILGMGDDGHTASWFPRADGLETALSETGAPVCAIRARQTVVTGHLTDRMTLTRAALAGAGMSLLLIAGEGKKAALESAMADGPVADMPVRALLRSETDRPDIHWAP